MTATEPTALSVLFLLQKELELPARQLLGLFNRIIRKAVQVKSVRGCDRMVVLDVALFWRSLLRFDQHRLKKSLV